jgi:hypothetical protein
MRTLSLSLYLPFSSNLVGRLEKNAQRLEEMVKHSRKHRKTMRRGRKGVKGPRRMRGGGQGAGWTIGPAVAPGAPYAQTNQPYDACLQAPRPGSISYADSGGLPGMGGLMKGGGMNNVPPGPVIAAPAAPVAPMKGGGCDGGCFNPANGDLDKIPLMKGGRRRTQSGGRYTMNLTSDIAGFAQIDKIPCEPNWSNPLNQRMQSGGGSGGLSTAADMGVYEAPTARYTHTPSQWTDSVGAPVLLNVPLDAKMWSRACTQTGGKRRKGRKGSKKARKTRGHRRH